MVKFVFGVKFRLAIAVFVALPAFSGKAHAEIIYVDTAAALVLAVSEADPGSEIVIVDGHYADWRVRLNGRGKANQPITIRPETSGGVVFSGTTHFRLSGEHLVIRDLVFQGITVPSRSAVILMENIEHSRITGCHFLHSRMGQGTFVVYLRNNAHDNRIDHSVFVDTHHRVIGMVRGRDGTPMRNRVDHNLIQDVPPLGRNGAETIQIAAHTGVDAENVVEDNTFIRCNGEAEIISVKANATTIRRNRFYDCEGELVLRNTKGSVIEDNFFIGGQGGIRVSGRQHRITGNTIVSPRENGISLTYGSSDEAHVAAYPHVVDCVIESNTILHAGEAGIFVGTMRNRTWHSERWAQPPYNDSADLDAAVAPHGNRIRNNTLIGDAGKLLVDDHAPDNDIAANTFIELPALKRP